MTPVSLLSLAGKPAGAGRQRGAVLHGSMCRHTDPCNNATESRRRYGTLVAAGDYDLIEEAAISRNLDGAQPEGVTACLDLDIVVDAVGDLGLR